MPQSEYVSIQELRDEGFSITEFPDARLRRLIQRASSKIDLFTCQSFVPEEKTYSVDGSGDVIITMPNMRKIIKVDKINICVDKSSSKRINCGMYYYDTQVIPDRRFFGTLCNNKGYSIGHNDFAIELLGDYEDTFVNLNYDIRPTGFPVIFPEGSKNIEVEGVFGWLENIKYVCQEVEIASSVGNNFITVEDSTKFEQFDQIIIRLSRPICLRVLDIDDANNRLIVDTLTKEIPENTEVCTYGKIPDCIVDATMRLVHDYSQQIYPSEDCTVGGFDPRERHIFKEKTDNYSWEADPKYFELGMNRDYINYASTGNIFVDRILQAFLDQIPPYWGYV